MSDTWMSDMSIDLPPDEQLLYDSLDELMRKQFYPLRGEEQIEFPMLGRKIAGMYLFTHCLEDGCDWKTRRTLSREEIDIDCDLTGYHLQLARTKNQEALRSHYYSVEHNASVCDHCGDPEPPHIGCIMAALLNSDYYSDI